MKKLSVYLCTLLLLLVADNSGAALLIAVDGYLYDDKADLFWVQDLSLFASMTLTEQLDAIDQMPSLEYMGVEYDWRLATVADVATLIINDPLQAWGCVGACAEDQRQFFGNLGGYRDDSWRDWISFAGRIDLKYGDSDAVLSLKACAFGLSELWDSQWVISSTYFLKSADIFNMTIDTAFPNDENMYLQAWVVGVPSPVVPIPANLWLLGTGLIGLFVFRKKSVGD